MNDVTLAREPGKKISHVPLLPMELHLPREDDLTRFEGAQAGYEGDECMGSTPDFCTNKVGFSAFNSSATSYDGEEHTQKQTGISEAITQTSRWCDTRGKRQ